MPNPTTGRAASKPEIQDARWGKVFASRAAAPTADYTTIECRALRNEFNRQNKGYVPGTWGVIRAALTGLNFIARKQIAHHSTQMYLVSIKDGTAKHYLITEKCSWKSAGTAAATPEELAAWNKAYPDVK